MLLATCGQRSPQSYQIVKERKLAPRSGAVSKKKVESILKEAERQRQRDRQLKTALQLPLQLLLLQVLQLLLLLLQLVVAAVGVAIDIARLGDVFVVVYSCSLIFKRKGKLPTSTTTSSGRLCLQLLVPALPRPGCLLRLLSSRL